MYIHPNFYLIEAFDLPLILGNGAKLAFQKSNGLQGLRKRLRVFRDHNVQSPEVISESFAIVSYYLVKGSIGVHTSETFATIKVYGALL